MDIKHYITAASIAAGALFTSAQEPIENTATAIQEATDTISSLYDELDEFVITAKKEIVKSDGARLTYDLEQDDTSKGQSVLDALRKVPMVTVDGQDNIYIKGSQNFRIYVNGKEDPMLTANASKVLKAMPSESVSKIEVITEPGAKYDAEGTAGILNLVTERKQRKDGYAGSASVSFSSQDLGASLYGRVKYDKVTADASINYANNSLQKQSQFNRDETIDNESDLMHRQISDLDQSFTFNYIGANFNLSWEPTDKDLFSVGANLTDIDARVNRLDMTTWTFTRTGDLHLSTLQKIRGSMQNLGASGNVSYRRLFSDSGHSLTTAYRFNYGRNPWDLDYLNSTEYGTSRLEPHETNRQNTYQREHTVTADYVNPIGSGNQTIETGVKGIFRRNSSTTNRMTGETAGTMATIENGITNQIQDVYAAYAVYNGSFDKIALTGGLRYEHTYMGLDFVTGESENFRRNLDDVVPNAAITYMFGPAANLRLAYQMRISRPSISQMNPTPFKIAQTFAKIGNPDLESERYNSVSLTYSNYGQVVGGNVSLSYNQSNNTIESYNYYEDGTWYDTYGNFGKNRRGELSGFLNWNINSRMSLSVNGNVNFTSIKSGKGDLSNHGWNGGYGANYNYTGPWNVKYSLYGGQSTGNIQLQGSWSGWYYYGLGISKSFLKDNALTLAVNASNFLTKYTTWKSHTSTGAQTMNSTGRNRSWNVGISLSWNFGHLKEQVKKTDANLDNDDSKNIGGKGGGIGM